MLANCSDLSVSVCSTDSAGRRRPLFACFTATMTASDFFRSYISVS